MSDKNRDKPLFHVGRPLRRGRKTQLTKEDVTLTGADPGKPTTPAVESFLNLLAEILAKEAIREHQAAREVASPKSPVIQSSEPRLLDLPSAAAYLGLSTWTLRELPIPRVRPIRANGRDLRKILYDRRDLDDWIERSKNHPQRRGRHQ